MHFLLQIWICFRVSGLSQLHRGRAGPAEEDFFGPGWMTLCAVCGVISEYALSPGGLFKAHNIIILRNIDGCNICVCLVDGFKLAMIAKNGSLYILAKISAYLEPPFSFCINVFKCMYSGYGDNRIITQVKKRFQKKSNRCIGMVQANSTQTR